MLPPAIFACLFGSVGFPLPGFGERGRSWFVVGAMPGSIAGHFGYRRLRRAPPGD